MDQAPLRAAVTPVALPREMGGPVLIFGGCNSNLEATAALRSEAQRLDIPASRTICTGDVAAYCADPVETVDLIREWGVSVVMGNCEESLGWQRSDCIFNHANAQVTEEQRGWMRSLPRRLDLIVSGLGLTVVHGAVDSIDRFIFPSMPSDQKAHQIALAGGDGVVAGHSGIPFIELSGNKLWLNAGAIGMPANDGTPRGWYAFLTPLDDGVEVRTIALDYDYRSATRKVRERQLGDGLAAALETGLWPTSEVLPASELRRRGQPISPERLLWRRPQASKGSSVN
jgi:predicted phosphodiesterase